MLMGPLHHCKDQAKANKLRREGRDEAPKFQDAGVKGCLSWENKVVFRVLFCFFFLVCWATDCQNTRECDKKLTRLLFTVKQASDRNWLCYEISEFSYPFGCINYSSGSFALQSGGRALAGCNKASPRVHCFSGAFFMLQTSGVDVVRSSFPRLNAVSKALFHKE